MATKEKKASKTSSMVFFSGFVIFVLGIIGYFMKITIPAPTVAPIELNGSLFYMPFLNWLVILGIAAMLLGFALYYLLRKRNS